MIEIGEQHNAEVEARMGSFKQLLGEWQEKPPGNDMYIAAYATAVERSLTQDTRLGAFLDELLTRRDMGSATLATKVLRATQRQMLFGGWQPEDGEYPRSFHVPEQWLKGFDWIFTEDGGIREEQFFTDVWARPLQSNVSERYMALKAFAVFARKLGRLSTVRLLDIGTSQAAGLNHIASGLAFPPPNFVMPGSVTRTPHVPRTAAFHEAINAPFDGFEAVGTDLFKLADGWQWAWSCSHYPGELEDEARVERTRSLMGDIYPNVAFFQANFTSFEARRDEFESMHGNRFTISHWSNVLGQLDATDRQAMLQQAAPYTEDFMMVNDFLDIDPSDPRKLIFRDNWFHGDDYTYQTVVRDMRTGDERWRPIFKWSDARMRRVTMGQGRIALLDASGGVQKHVSLWQPLNDIAARHGLTA